MPTTSLPKNPVFPTYRRRLPDSTVLDRVRTAFLEADNQNARRPGRPALVELTGGTEHQVRRAMRIAESQILQPETLATQTSPEDHQNGTPLETPKLPTPQIAPPQSDDQPPPGGTDSPPQAADASGNQSPDPPRAWPLGLIGLAAAVAVWGGWVDLGELTGFGMVQPLPGLVDEFWINTAIVLPVGIEAYGGYALRAWLSSAALSARTRSYAGWSALAGRGGCTVVATLSTRGRVWRRNRPGGTPKWRLNALAKANSEV